MKNNKLVVFLLAAVALLALPLVAQQFGQGWVRILALALLLFEMGSRVNLGWLRHNKALWLASLAEALFSGTAVGGLLWLLGLSPLMAVSCAVLTLAASGAVIGRVGAELKAAGQVSERMLVLTALNTLYAVLAHKLLLGWLQ